MIPPLIVQQALERQINLIAITDHYSTANIQAVIEAARGTDLHVLPGVELQTVEEVHVLCIFDHLEQANAFQCEMDADLPGAENNIEYFGEQFVVDASGDFIRREERLLLNSTSLSLREAWQHVSALGGLLIPAHINRKAFGLLPVLGFVPPDTPIEILEISTHITPETARERYAQVAAYPLLQNGDAHFLDDIKGPNRFTMEMPGVAEIRLAALNQAGRAHQIVIAPQV